MRRRLVTMFLVVAHHSVAAQAPTAGIAIESRIDPRAGRTLASHAARAVRDGGYSRQACAAGAYRWPQKVDVSLATLTPKRAYVGTVLSTWSLPDLWGGSSANAAPRQGRELSVYYVVGWVRRIDMTEDDCDWHIEITSTRTADSTKCLVVEIPRGLESGLFDEARASFEALLGSSPHDGVVSPPVRMEFIGPAFFDSQHRGSKTANPNGAHGHGYCNSSARALWEIHPVYWVVEP